MISMRNNKWLIGFLLVSLTLNLLLIGFLAGRLSGLGAPPPFGPDPTSGFVRLLGFLDTDRRASIKPVLRSHMNEIMPTLRNVRRNQRAVFDALTAEPFDPDKLTRALDALQSNLSAAQLASHESFVAMAAELTPAERRQLAAAMRHPPPRHRPGAGSERRDGPPLGVQPRRSGFQIPQEVR
jgi:uncharacterized membrane protein